MVARSTKPSPDEQEPRKTEVLITWVSAFRIAVANAVLAAIVGSIVLIATA